MEYRIEIGSRKVVWILALIGSYAVQAQVFIPDLNLRAKLDSLAPGCINGAGVLDTLHAGLNMPQLYINVWWTPSDLTGVQYITTEHVTLEYSYGFSQTTSLPGWPKGMTDLSLNAYPGSTVPDWPVGHELTYISYAPMLSALPPLPSTQRGLALHHVPMLSSLPPFPASLESLSLVSADILTSIPPVPLTTTGFWVEDCPQLTSIGSLGSCNRIDLIGLPLLTTIPTIPPTTTDLFIDHAGLTSLSISTQPDKIRLRDLPLTALPDLDSVRLVVRLIDLPNLLTLPALPDTVSGLHLEGLNVATLPDWSTAYIGGIDLIRLPNISSISAFSPSAVSVVVDSLPQITSVPVWPNAGLYHIELTNCPGVTCLPALPWGLVEFDVSGSGVSCLPNVPPGMVQMNWPALAQCTPVSSCPILTTAITGRIFHDVNGNGSQDPGEAPLQSGAVHVDPANYYSGTDSTGTYDMHAPPGNYSIYATYNSPYLLGISPLSHTAVLTSYSDQDSLNDFGVQLQANIQDLTLEVDREFARPGFDNRIYLHYKNSGTIPVSADLSFTYDAVQSWVGSSVAPSTISGNTVTWNLPNLMIEEMGTITVDLHTDSTVAIGTGYTLSGMIDPVVTDNTPLDNVFNWNDTVVGSFDPNDKLLTPSVMTPAEVQQGDTPIEYTIRFQNTGTYLAERVVITDTLSPDLQLNSFEFVSSSHASTWQIEESVLYFIFDDIFLPDSASDEAGSHGFVRFRMLPSDQLLNGAVIENVANIYFDFNAPVITEPSVFNVDVLASIAELDEKGLQVYPNPVANVLHLQLDGTWNDEVDFGISDITGRELARGALQGTQHVLSTASLPVGSYILQVADGERTASARFVKR